MAFLSGVSLSWYTWLEQGRDINPSRQVIDAIALQLRLTRSEHDYVLGLCGFAPAPAVIPIAPDEVPAHVQLLLDALDPSPAFAITQHWDIAAWNRGYVHLFPGVVDAPPAERNLLLFVFTHPYVRRMLPDWPVTSRQFLAEYRADSAGRGASEDHSRLIAHLREVSADFASAWDEHEVQSFASRRRSFVHPVDGPVEFEQLNLLVPDAADLRVIAYLPADSASA